MRSCVADFEVATPGRLSAVLSLLANGDGWRPMAGGTDLMVLLNAGRLPFSHLVSLRAVAELSQIEVREDMVGIGAAVTYSQIQRHPVLQAEFPLLSQAASWTGGVANQNQGTLGGNIVNGSPAADSAAPLLVHDASVRLICSSGERTVPYHSFHLGYKQFAMRADELIYAVELPRRSSEWRCYGRKVGTRKAQAISKVSFAGAILMDQGAVANVRIAAASVAPGPLRCPHVERALMGVALSSDTIGMACQALHSDLQPIDDIRSTAAYRSQVTQNLLREFLEGLP